MKSLKYGIIHKFRPTLSMQIDITNACNLRCTHCYHPSHSNLDCLKVEEWDQILEKYQRLLSKYWLKPTFSICGGEPTISPNFIKILKLIDTKFSRCNVSILTNGTYIKESLLQQLPEKLNYHFQISLDGSSADDHDKIRGPGSYQRAVNGIKLLKQHGYSVSIQSVLSKVTALQIESFFILASHLKVDLLNFVRLVAKSAEQKLLLLSAAELKITYQKILLASTKYQISTPLRKPLFQLLHPKLGGAGGYGDGLVIDYKGNVKLSSRLGISIGSALYGNIEEIYFKNPIISAIKASNIWGCIGCPHIKRCGGDRNAAYIDSGDYLGVDPGCWFITQRKNKNEQDK